MMKQPLHVAYYAPAWPPSGAANGIVTHIARMHEALTGLGHHVSILAENRWHASDGSVVQLSEVPVGTAPWSKLTRRWGAARGDLPHVGRQLADQFAFIHKERRIDVIQMEESFGWAGVVQGSVDVPVVVRLHGPHFMSAHRSNGRKGRQRIQAEGRTIQSARAVTAPSNHTMEATRSEYGFRTNLVAVIPNPIIVANRDETWSPRLCDDWTALWVGRFDLAKGADIALRAFAIAADSMPELQLTMIGPDEGFEVNGRRLNYQQYAKAHLPTGLAERIRFLGHQPPDVIRAERLRAFVTFMSSRSESFSNVALEALASGAPFVATDCGGVREIVGHGKSGWLVPNEDYRALAEQLRWVFRHRSEAAHIAAAGRERCSEVFSPKRVGLQTISFFQNVIARQANSPL